MVSTFIANKVPREDHRSTRFALNTHQTNEAEKCSHMDRSSACDGLSHLLVDPLHIAALPFPREFPNGTFMTGLP